MEPVPLEFVLTTLSRLPVLGNQAQATSILRYRYVAPKFRQGRPLKLYVYFVGKPRDKHANGIAEEFLKRTNRYVECSMREIVPARFPLFEKHASAKKIFLDPAGRTADSAGFIQIVRTAEQAGQDLLFLVGGHDGLPAEWRDRGDMLLSLSPMTFPHELARVMLLEQIYRAYTTLRGHPYPR